MLCVRIERQRERSPGTLILYHFAGHAESCSSDPVLMMRRLTAEVHSFCLVVQMFCVAVSACLAVCLFVCFFVSLSLSVCSVCPFGCLFVCLFVCPFVCLSVCLSIRLSV